MNKNTEGANGCVSRRRLLAGTDGTGVFGAFRGTPAVVTGHDATRFPGRIAGGDAEGIDRSGEDV